MESICAWSTPFCAVVRIFGWVLFNAEASI
jgi:hypothetical protein